MGVAERHCASGKPALKSLQDLAQLLYQVQIEEKLAQSQCWVTACCMHELVVDQSLAVKLHPRTSDDFPLTIFHRGHFFCPEPLLVTASSSEEQAVVSHCHCALSAKSLLRSHWTKLAIHNCKRSSGSGSPWGLFCTACTWGFSSRLKKKKKKKKKKS